MSKRDFYEILGVTKGCDEAALKSAYRKLAKQFHPDVNKEDPAAEAKFKEASEAYEIFSRTPKSVRPMTSSAMRRSMVGRGARAASASIRLRPSPTYSRICSAI